VHERGRQAAGRRLGAGGLLVWPRAGRPFDRRQANRPPSGW